eukprot:SAG31_NODE_591_length_13740_cov_11.032256_9_plen_679_part_00
MSAYVTVHNQTLDMAMGELTTFLRIAPPGVNSSWSLELSVVQFLSRDIPSLGVQRITATASPASLHYTVQPHITTDRLSETAQPYTDTIPIRNHWGEGPAYAKAIRTNIGAKLALAVESECGSDASPTDYKQSQAQGCDSAKQGDRSGYLVMTSFVSIVSDVYHARPSVAALELAHKGFYIGYKRLRARNSKVWRESWRGRVVISGESGADPTLLALDQATLDAALFYLLSSAHPMSSQGLAICGLSCTDYRNMQSWDTDWFMLHALSVLDKDSAAAVAAIRKRTLPEAQSYAALLGYRGARTPVAIEGRDGYFDSSTNEAFETGAWQTGTTPVSVWRVANTMNDAVYYREVAWPVLREAATFILSRGTWARGPSGARTGEFALNDWSTDSSQWQSVDQALRVSALFIQVLTAAIDCTKHLPDGYFEPRVRDEWQRAVDGFQVNRWGDILLDNAAVPHNESAILACLADRNSSTQPVWCHATDSALNFGVTLDGWLHGIGSGIPDDTIFNQSVFNATELFAAHLEDVLNRTYGIKPPCQIEGALPGLGEYFFCAKRGALRAYFGDRVGARRVLSSLGQSYMLPPFFTTTEVASAAVQRVGGRDFGHYMTNWGAQLQAVLFGLTGLRVSDGPEQSWVVGLASMPAGWAGLHIERLWLQGEEWSMSSTHGHKTVLSKLPW